MKNYISLVKFRNSLFNLFLLLIASTLSSSLQEQRDPESNTLVPIDSFTIQTADYEASSSNKNSEQNHLVIPTPQGQIKGKVVNVRNYGNVANFLGIPYAQPPVGDLRFRPPVPPRSWEGVKDATEFSSICYQPGEQKIFDVVNIRNRSTVRKRKLEHYTMSEDCLYLSIYLPLNNDTTLNLPSRTNPLSVFFYIHGGSYYMNAGRLYPGHILSATQNIIVVTFNFRLGPIGFLSTEDSAASGNFGLLDQARALDWVYENIRYFGGDPNKITLVGNSAGGASAMFHLVSPLSMGKFRGITVQSGCSSAPWAVQASPKKHAEDLAKKLGCPVEPTSDLIDCMRTFSAKTIMKHAILEDGLSLAYAPVIDGKYGGKFLPAHPQELIRQNQFYHVPILSGFTKDEVTIWFTKWGPSTPAKHLKQVLEHDVVSLIRNIPTVTDANHAAAYHSVKVQYLYRYGILENATLGKTSAVSDFISDVGLKAPCINEMNLLSQYNDKPIYLYEFQYYSVDDVKMNRQEWIGSYHESELQFIFGEAYLNYSNHLRSYDDKKMSDLMMRLWGNFVRYGNPTPNIKSEKNQGLKFTWTNYTETNQDFAVIGLKSHMSKYFYTDKMLFWNYFFPIFRDYTFKYEGPVRLSCNEWSMLVQTWPLWVLISLISFLAFLFITYLLYLIKFQGKNNHSLRSSTRKVTNNSNHIIPNNAPGHTTISSNSNSCRGSLVIRSPCQCQSLD